jgi:hypothetical protein
MGAMVLLLPVPPMASRTVSTVGFLPAAASWAAAFATWEYRTPALAMIDP